MSGERTVAPAGPLADTAPRGVLVILGLLVLHTLVSLRFPWEIEGPVAAWAKLSPDLLLILAVGLPLWKLLGHGRPRSRALACHAVAVSVLVVPLYRFGSTVMPVFYGKELDLYNDLSMAPSLVHLFLHRHPAWLQVVLSLLAIAVAVLFYLAVYWMARNVLRASASRRWSRGFLTAGLLVLPALFLDGGFARAGKLSSKSLLVAFTRDAFSSFEKWRQNRDYARLLAEAEQHVGAQPDDLAGLGGADVAVLFIESYGRALFRDPEQAPRFAAWAEGWEAALRADGFFVCTGLIQPAVSGGGSSMAHAEFMSGIIVPHRRAFDMLLASSLRPLPHAFEAAGYRTFNVQPATHGEWPEGAFFGFAEDVFLPAFPYEGHTFHWGYMPDQFALAHLLDTRIDGSEQPVFLQYVSVTSHAPFSMVPPYYDDWSRATEPGAFAEPERLYDIDWLSYTGHPDVEEAYMEVIHYSLETMVGFARELTPRRALVLILGDHQPPNVGDLRDQDSSFYVPLHAISNDPDLLLPFVATGFTPGFVPADDADGIRSWMFRQHFLQAYSGGR